MAAPEDMDDDGKSDPYILLREKLVEMGLLTESGARIYEYTLRHGTVTSSDVARDLDIRPSTAKTRLDRLVDDGRLEKSVRIGEERRTGKGHPVKYIAVPAKKAFRAFFEQSSELSAITDLVLEPTELKAESSGNSGDIWIAEAEHLAITEGIERIESAHKIVQICSRDGTWMTDPGLTNAISKITKNSVKVKIAASEITSEMRATAKRIGAVLVKSIISGPTFCIVDKAALLVPFKPRPPRDSYQLLVTTHQYLVKEFVKYFESLPSASKSG